MRFSRVATGRLTVATTGASRVLGVFFGGIPGILRELASSPRVAACSVDDAHLEHLPGSFSPLVATRLERQRDEVLRIDHPYRHTS